MNKQFLCALVTHVTIMTIATGSYAGGYRITEQSASAMSMANAFTAQADDPSAVWYNPAGITQLDVTRIVGGVSFVFPSISHENTDATTDVSKRDISVPFRFYGTNKINDRIFLVLSINNPFGLTD